MLVRQSSVNQKRCGLLTFTTVQEWAECCWVGIEVGTQDQGAGSVDLLQCSDVSGRCSDDPSTVVFLRRCAIFC